MKLLTIITVTYNAKDTLKKTLESLRAEKSESVEYIIIDGGSTDGTLELIAAFDDSIDIVVSEHDRGIYDALNKGLQLSSGRFIGTLHAGSQYRTGALREALKQLDEQKDKICAFSAQFLSDDEKIYKREKMAPLSPYNTTIFHETLIVPKICYDLIGNFNIKYQVSADFDWISRAVNSHIPIVYFNLVLIDYFAGWGFSNSWQSRFLKLKEHLIIMRKHVGLTFALKRFLKKLIAQLLLRRV
jgi:glycosyltransferase involved in cell wall biosynthesis